MKSGWGALPVLAVLACTPAEAPVTVSKAKPAPEIPAGSGVQVIVDFAERRRHRIEVTARYPATDEALVLAMPVWTPGSYLIREYPRHIESFEAFNATGESLKVERLSKSRRRIDAPGQAVTLRYRLYARDATVRTNFVDDELAVINPAASFLWDVARPELPYTLRFKSIPESWTHVETQLATDGSSWTASSFEAFVDGPLVLGQAEVSDFVVEGITHRLATFGGDGRFPHKQAAEDLPKIVREAAAVFKEIPYKRYVFLNVVNETRGGLEHDESTLLMTSRNVGASQVAYRKWLGLASHEFFHVWNVRRLKPKGLIKLDLETETYTPDLWVSEGVTSYYDDLLLRRAGLLSEKQYQAVLGELLRRMLSDQGHRNQSLSEASLDAWIKYYRPHEGSADTMVSYYVKGAVLALVLDAALRRHSDDRFSLDDVMLAAWNRYGKQGFSSDEWFELFSEFGSPAVERLARTGANTTTELGVQGALTTFGLRIADDKAPKDADARKKQAWLGVGLGGRGGLTITRVHAGSPAEKAGLTVGDELLALDSLRIESASSLLGFYKPEDRAEILFARRGSLRTLTATIGKKPKTSWKVEISPMDSVRTQRRRAAWHGTRQTLR